MRKSESQPEMKVVMEVAMEAVEVAMEVVTATMEVVTAEVPSAVLAGEITEVAEVPEAAAVAGAIVVVADAESPKQINAAVFRRAAADRAAQLGALEDPFTAVAVTPEYESFLEIACYHSLFKLDKGLKAELIRIENDAWYFIPRDFEEHLDHEDQVQKSICYMLDYIFGIIFIPQSHVIHQIVEDEGSTFEERHGLILNALPRRIRRALPKILKWNVMPYEFTSYDEYKEDMIEFDVEEEVQNSLWQPPENEED